jgi:putative ABC transport system permease protein
MGIRRALGASQADLAARLVRDLLAGVALACVFAAPLAFVGADWWLQDFAYRVEIGPEPFLVACAVAALVAFVATTYQTIRVARVDPAVTLRAE